MDIVSPSESLQVQYKGLPYILFLRVSFLGTCPCYRCAIAANYKVSLLGANELFLVSPAPGLWIQTVLPLAAFAPSFRGKIVQGAPLLHPERVRQVGLMISDKQAGLFRLMVKTFEAVPALTFAS